MVFIAQNRSRLFIGRQTLIVVVLIGLNTPLEFEVHQIANTAEYKQTAEYLHQIYQVDSIVDVLFDWYSDVLIE